MICLASLCTGHMNLLLNFSNTLVTIAVTLVVQAGGQLHSTGAFGWMIRRKNKETWDLKLLVNNLTKRQRESKKKARSQHFFFFLLNKGLSLGSLAMISPPFLAHAWIFPWGAFCSHLLGSILQLPSQQREPSLLQTVEISKEAIPLQACENWTWSE